MKIVTLFIFCVVAIQTQAQTASNLTKEWWLSPTIGIVLDQQRMPAGGFTFNRNIGSLSSVAVRAALGGEFLNRKSPGLKFTDVGLLYGLSVKKFYLGAGLSWLQGIKRGVFLSGPTPTDLFHMNNYQKVKYSTVGIPYEVRWVAIKSTTFGLGLSLNGNFSNQFSYTTIGLSMYFGKL